MKKPLKKEKPLNKKSSGKLPPYPVSPASEDIYRKSIEEQEVDPEDITKTKRPNETEQIANVDEDDFGAGTAVKKPGKKKRTGKRNEKDFEDDVSGGDLDVPGSELDDREEMNGNEDEENNYYSLGGDGHHDLDEDRGE
jgi:hypothetical protein